KSGKAVVGEKALGGLICRRTAVRALSTDGETMYLFLDTETTGVPRRRGAPVRQWPRLVQIAWTAYDEAGRRLGAEAHLVRPAGFAIPAAAVRIHGISTGRARREGQPVGWVIERLLRAVREQG